MLMNRDSIRARSAGRAAFTLIELLLVLVILAVLAAMVVPKFTGRSEQAKNAAAKTDISQIGNAIDQFEVDCGRYPTTEEGLRALLDAPSNAPKWHGPYIKRGAGVPKDPWGNEYVYRFPGTRNPDEFDLVSAGPNGKEGDADDVSNFSAQQ